MIRIDLESRAYDIVANVIATLISAGTACIAHAFCNDVISTSRACGKRTGLMQLGKYGLDATVMFGATPNVRIAIDELAEAYNHLVDMDNAYEAVCKSDSYVEVSSEQH